MDFESQQLALPRKQLSDSGRCKENFDIRHMMNKAQMLTERRVHLDTNLETGDQNGISFTRAFLTPI